MTQPDRRRPTTFIARSSADLVAVAPQLLGFHPHDSVVLLTFGAGDCFHARVDLPVDEDAQLAVVEMLAEVIARHGVAQVALLLYTDDAWVAATFHDAAVPVLVQEGVDVIDVLRVSADRFHRADDPADAGTPYDLMAHPFTAEQVVRGKVVHASRDELAATLATVDLVDAQEVAAAAERYADRCRGLLAFVQGDRLVDDLDDDVSWMEHVLRRHIGFGAPLSADDAGRVLALVSFEAARDVAWVQMSRPDAGRHVELWRDLVRRCPPGLIAPAASLLAFAAWLEGDGALAWCALDRVAEVDPSYSMAGFIAALLERAVPPSAWALVDELGPSGGASRPAAS